MNHSNEILPCPFCGKTPVVTQGWRGVPRVGEAWVVSIACVSRKCVINPEAKGHTVFAMEKVSLKTRLTKLWNRRKHK